ncbi:MAG: amidohydrolase family protein [Roseobacter sp.]
MVLLHDIRVPRVLLRAADAFGGQRDDVYQRGDLIQASDGSIRLIAAHPTNAPRLLVPGLVEAHCHLDKCHTIDRIGPVGGDLTAALEAQRRDKARWTADDLRNRAHRGIKEAQQAGCVMMRTHADWGDGTAPPVNWSVLTELAADTAGLALQCAALTGIDKMADAGYARAVARRVATDNGVLGSFILHHDAIEEGVRQTIAVADHFGLPLDFHVDEGLGDWNGLEVIADIALETGFAGPILCGHAVSLMDKDAGAVARIAGKLARAGVFVCALPTTNLYLQGRRAGTPDRRGITRLRELHAAGVRILVGSDNVADAFCPTGQHDPRAALHLAALTAHLDPPFDRWVPGITTDAAIALGRSDCFVEDCALGDLRLCDSPTLADFIAGRAPLVPLNALIKEAPS